MFSRILELITGRDDLERVAYKEDLGRLNDYLRTRRILVPRRPRRFVDASSFTEQELVELIRRECEEMAGDAFEPWILQIDGKRRLPAFSSLKRMETFSGKISKEMDKVFALGGGEFLLKDIVKGVDVDFVDLNLFNKKSWEIGVRKSVELQ